MTRPTIQELLPTRRQTNRQLITDAGLDIEVDELVTMQQPEGDATFQCVIAAKPDR